MKKSFIAVVLTAFCLTGCTKKVSNKVVIYSCSEDYKNEFYLAELQKKFPQYEITLDYQSSGGAAAKLQAEGEKTGGDILLSWDFTYLDMLSDYLADISYFDYSIFMADLQIPSKKYVPELRNSGCTVVNTQLLKEKGLPEPTCYDDLLKPEYKGLLSMPNPKSSGTGYMFLKQLVNEWGEDKAFEYFDGFAENALQFTSSGSGPINSLIQKETAVALGMTGQAVTVINEGAPLKIIFFEEGAPCSLYGHAITKKAEKSANYAIVKEVFDYLVKDVTPRCDELYYPEQVYVGKVFNVKNYPTDIKYGDMSNNTVDEKKRLLEKWMY